MLTNKDGYVGMKSEHQQLNASQFIWLGIMSIVLILVCVPRFNRRDRVIDSYTTEGRPASINKGDAAQYEEYVRYFRGKSDSSKLQAPFTYRPLVPFIASLLPFDEMTALNVVNVSSLLIGMIFLYLILRYLEISFFLCVIGCAVYSISFPTFYYGAIGYLDPVLLCLIMAGTYCIIKRYVGLLFIVLTIGIFCKESIILLLPVLFTHLVISRKMSIKKVVGLTLVLFVYLAAIYHFIKLNVAGVSTFMWRPSVDTLVSNLQRPRATLSFLLSFGIPGALATVFIVRNFAAVKNRDLAAFLTGFLGALFFSGYSFVAAYADGRFVWLSYPFSIPISMFFVNKMIMKKDINLI